MKWLIHAGELSTVAILFLVALPARGPEDEGPKPVLTSAPVTHVNLKSSKPFAAVTEAIERQLGKFDPAIEKSIGSTPAEEIESRIRAMEGSSGLMLFAVRDHGRLLALRGKETLARQYEIGNPLVALEMTEVDPRAGEYAPVRIYVYVDDDNLTHIDYDLPSSVFGRFKSDKIDRVAEGLDQKLATLVRNALKN